MTKEDMQTLLDMFDERLDKKFDKKLEPINERWTKIELKIENEVDRSIKVTMEGHTDLNRKMDKALGLENPVENLENKMSAVEYVVKKAE